MWALARQTSGFPIGKCVCLGAVWRSGAHASHLAVLSPSPASDRLPNFPSDEAPVTLEAAWVPTQFLKVPRIVAEIICASKPGDRELRSGLAAHRTFYAGQFLPATSHCNEMGVTRPCECLPHWPFFGQSVGSA